MSAAKGMWYQSESKLKIPRSSASFVVRPQCAKTREITPTVTTHASHVPSAGGAGEGEGGSRTDRDSPAVPPSPCDRTPVQAAVTAARTRDTATRTQA